MHRTPGNPRFTRNVETLIRVLRVGSGDFWLHLFHCATELNFPASRTSSDLFTRVNRRNARRRRCRRFH